MDQFYIGDRNVPVLPNHAGNGPWFDVRSGSSPAVLGPPYPGQPAGSAGALRRRLPYRDARLDPIWAGRGRSASHATRRAAFATLGPRPPIEAGMAEQCFLRRPASPELDWPVAIRRGTAR